MGRIKQPQNSNSLYILTDLDCSCCGKPIENSTDQNASFGLAPYPHDQGFGMCFDCGGDSQSDDIRTQLGWAGRMFFETRMSIVRKHLNPENRAKFDAMNYERKVSFIGLFIGLCIKRGLMI
jgi:hypothetical protein